MDINPRSIDCYFYYYSVCLRGNNCRFRHEQSALGCEVMCSKWKDGSCAEEHCSLRHMELKKKRKEIPCYWESQPGGCMKAHCAFLHQSKGGHGAPAQADLPSSPTSVAKEEDSQGQEWRSAHSEAAASLDVASDTASVDSARRLSQSGPENYSSSPAPVEPIVVNFEEESDSESAPSWTPTKMPKEKDSLHVKTLEEIRLEKIQAESAAYWEGVAGGPMAWEAANPAANPSCSNPCGISAPATRKLFLSHVNNTAGSFQRSKMRSKTITKELDFKILSLDEIRRNRKKKEGSRAVKSGDISVNFMDVRSHKTTAVNGHGVGLFKSIKAQLASTDKWTRLKNDGENANSSPHRRSGDVGSLKRLNPDTLMSTAPDKKQRVRLRRLSDLIDRNTSMLGMHSELSLCAETGLHNIEDNILRTIDQYLMK